MGYSKNASDIKSAFPHGLKIVKDNSTPVELIDLRVHDVEGVPTLVGWAPPSKDFYIDLDNVLVRKRDWLVFSRGVRLSLRPITKAREAQVRDMMY